MKRYSYGMIIKDWFSLIVDVVFSFFLIGLSESPNQKFSLFCFFFRLFFFVLYARFIHSTPNVKRFFLFSLYFIFIFLFTFCRRNKTKKFELHLWVSTTYPYTFFANIYSQNRNIYFRDSMLYSVDFNINLWTRHGPDCILFLFVQESIEGRVQDPFLTFV